MGTTGACRPGCSTQIAELQGSDRRLLPCLQGKGDRTLPNVLQVVLVPLIVGIVTLSQVGCCVYKRLCTMCMLTYVAAASCSPCH